MPDAFVLAERHTLAELQEMFNAARADPDNKSEQGSVQIYNKRGQRKIDALGDAISLRLKQKKIDNGTYETNGYSGRNSNRR